MKKRVKLDIGEEVRNIGKAPNSIYELIDITKEILEISDPAFQYKDQEGDIITLTHQLEYEEALKGPSDTLRFRVIEKNKIKIMRNVCTYSISDFAVDELQDLNQKDKGKYSESLRPTASVKNKATDSIECKDVGTQVSEYQNLFDSIDEIPHIHPEDSKFLCKICEIPIRNIGFICVKCLNFIICEYCEAFNDHEHVLIKAKGMFITQIMEKTSEIKIHIEKCEDNVVKPMTKLKFEEESKIDEIEPSFKLKRKNVTSPYVNSLESSPDVPQLKKNLTFANMAREYSDIIVAEKCDAESKTENKKLLVPKLQNVERSKSLESEDFTEVVRDSGISFKNSNEKANFVENLKKLDELGFTNKTENAKALFNCKYVLYDAITYLTRN